MTMKGLKKICSECGGKTELQAISLEVERHGIKATMTGVPPWSVQDAESNISLERLQVK